MAVLRVKPDVASVVFDESTGGFVTLAPHTPFDSNDPVVKGNRWAFETEAEMLERDAQPGRITSVNFDEWAEKATAVPGEKRDVQHAAPTSGRAADLDVIAAPEANNPGAFEDTEPETGNGPITNARYAVETGTPSLDAPESKIDRKAAAAKGNVPKRVARATKNATPKVVKKG